MRMPIQMLSALILERRLDETEVIDPDRVGHCEPPPVYAAGGGESVREQERCDAYDRCVVTVY